MHCFTLRFLLSKIPAGWICDRCKVSRLFLLCGTIYSVLTLLNPMAAKLGPNYMIALRFIQGMAHVSTIHAYKKWIEFLTDID